MGKHGNYAVSLGATLVGGITQQNVVTGTQVKGEASSGEVYRRILAMYEQKIAPGFTTRAIGTALAACGAVGASIADMTGGLAVYAQKWADGGSRASGSVHRKYGFAAGILAPRRLSVDHRGDATLSYDAIVTYDGNNAPLVITENVALPAPLVDGERFTLGKTTVGGVLLAQKRSLEIDFGLDIVGEGYDSDIWDVLASIRAVNSQITIRGADIEWLKDAGGIPLAGKAATHLDTTFYLRKRLAHGTFVPDATAGHIKFTASGMAYVDNALSASQGDGAETGLVMPLDFDGNNAPLVITVGAAIT